MRHRRLTTLLSALLFSPLLFSPLLFSPLLFSLILPAALGAQDLAPQPPEIQLVQPLSFGGLLVQSAGGRITLTPGGSLVPEGPGVQPGASPASMIARFRLKGPPRARFSLRLDPPAPVLANPAGGSIRLAAFQSSLPQMAGTFDATGAAEFKLGGTLDIQAFAPPGPYLNTQANLQLQLLDGMKPAVNQPFTLAVWLKAPLILVNTNSLDFGGLIPGSAPGSFEVLANGGHRSNLATGPTLFKGAPHPAAFSLRGPARTCYSIQLPTEVLLKGPNGTLKVHGFTCSTNPSGVLPENGLDFRVGATLRVDVQQPRGEYKGTFLVSVIYQ